MSALAPVLLGVFAASWATTGQALRYAAVRLVDVPNARSSHASATPRGGGIGIVAAFLAGLLALRLLGVVSSGLALALGPGTALVAAIGWLDDHRHVAARWRSLVHFTAAAWALWVLGGLPSLAIGGGRLQLGPAGWLLGALGIVWVTNLFNFMDGIDGIAAAQATSVSLAGGLLLLLLRAPELAAAALLLCAASAAFLRWNWQPARIFMGDVGSGALGYLFAVLAVASENRHALPLLGWVVLCGVFVFDATATLLRRLARGERIYEAHRSHAYQRAVTAGRPHAWVTLGVLQLNLLLALLVWAAALRPPLLPWAGGVALALLLGVYLAVERVRPMAG